MADSHEDKFNELKAQNARVNTECINLDKMKKDDAKLASKFYNNLRQDSVKGHGNIRGVGIEGDRALFIFKAVQIGLKHDSGAPSRSESRQILQTKIDQWSNTVSEMKGKQTIVRFGDECRVPNVCADNYPPTTLKEKLASFGCK